MNLNLSGKKNLCFLCNVGGLAEAQTFKFPAIVCENRLKGKLFFCVFLVTKRGLLAIFSPRFLVIFPPITMMYL